jgi:hypothetical protein
LSQPAYKRSQHVGIVIGPDALSGIELPTLPFDRALIDLLACARQVKQFQIINGLKPHLLEPALRGEHVGTIVRKDALPA